MGIQEVISFYEPAKVVYINYKVVDVDLVAQVVSVKKNMVDINLIDYWQVVERKIEQIVKRKPISKRVTYEEVVENLRKEDFRENSLDHPLVFIVYRTSEGVVNFVEIKEEGIVFNLEDQRVLELANKKPQIEEAENTKENRKEIKID